MWVPSGRVMVRWVAVPVMVQPARWTRLWW